MERRKWISWVVGTSLVSSGWFTLPVGAVPPNQSDITGTNIWNNTAPILENNGQLNPEMLNQAQRLSQELESAAARCCNAPPPPGLRRFALGPANPNQDCISPDCQQLNTVMEETKVFLDDVNRSQGERFSANRNRTW